MSTVLIAYTSNAGSTTEIAQAIAEELILAGHAVEIKRLEEIDDVAAYDAVLVGAPMIVGWHKSAMRFVRKHKLVLKQKKTAYFCSAVSLTESSLKQVGDTPLFIDEKLAKPVVNLQKVSFKERYALPEKYVQPMLKAAGQVKPLSVALFGGKLDLARLNFLQMIFVLLIIRAQPGDFRNWEAIRQWTRALPL